MEKMTKPPKTCIFGILNRTLQNRFSIKMTVYGKYLDIFLRFVTFVIFLFGHMKVEPASALTTSKMKVRVLVYTPHYYLRGRRLYSTVHVLSKTKKIHSTKITEAKSLETQRNAELFQLIKFINL